MHRLNILGVDTGGTFTDLVYFDGAILSVHKVLSTPQAPERAILQGIREMGLHHTTLDIVHGSTVATNAILEGKGARTVYITNYGLADVLTIGRQARRELYDLQPPVESPPVEAGLCLETGGRLSADGEVIEPLTDDELEDLVRRVRQIAPQSVAINLMFSFLDDRFERLIEDAMPEQLFVSRSSRVLPEYREYERGMATWMNSYVGPVMQSYLDTLQAELPQCSINVMQSHGGTIAAKQAGEQAVHLVLSGPAGGLMGAKHVAEASGLNRLMSFDMGGTSTDVALIDGDIRLTSNGSIGPYPVAVPMVDMHTIGAGGGSIASVDAGGLLQVGPESAGANPGPACYGQGGTRPTVTDANLLLGRLPSNIALCGGMSVDYEAAGKALNSLAILLGLTAEQAANGVLQLANEHMAQALRVISVQKGLDPADYTLVSFGGAGGLHVCDLAESLNMHQALVPVHAGVLSALGMLVAPRSRQLSMTLGGLLTDYTDIEITAQLDSLAERGQAQMQDEGITSVQSEYSLDLRYMGQSSTLSVPWTNLTDSQALFHSLHRQQFGHDMDIAVELVNIRVALVARSSAPQLPKHKAGHSCTPEGSVAIPGVSDSVPVYTRAGLFSGNTIIGPALIMEPVSTTLIMPGWSAEVDVVGNLILRRE